MGITFPTPIQEQVFDPIQKKQDILAQSSTGTGKTLAFVLPLALNLAASKSDGQSLDPKGPAAPAILVLTPTRELADQVALVFQSIAKPLHFQTLCITGGKRYDQQRALLKQGVDVIIGTPGRIVDLMKQKTLNLTKIQAFVLDEVDQMLDLGFAEDLRALGDVLPKQRQTLFFSATLAPKVKAVAKNLLKNPIDVRVEKKELHQQFIRHGFTLCATGRKVESLVHLLFFHKPESGLIFCRTKDECAEVFQQLRQKGFDVAQLHGDIKQSERTFTWDQFRKRTVRFLVATDVAARGLDVSGLSHVFHLDVPFHEEAYTHRSGRTGRAGEKGQSWSLITASEKRRYEMLMHRLNTAPFPISLPSSDMIVSQFLKDMTSQAPQDLAGPVNTLVSEFLNSLSPEDILSHLRNHLLQKVEKLQKSLYNQKLLTPAASPLLRRFDDGPRGPRGRQGRQTFREGASARPYPKDKSPRFEREKPFFGKDEKQRFHKGLKKTWHSNTNRDFQS